MVGAIGRWGLRRLFPGVISEIHSGLGNQMFQYAAGRSLADRLGTDYALCIKDFSQDYAGRTFGLDAFNLRAAEVGYWATSVYKDYAGWRGKLAAWADADADEWWQKVSVREPGTTQAWPQLLKASGPIMLTGYWQSELYFADNRERLLADFEPKAALTGSQAELARQMQGSNTVSVHVRRGDYAHHPHISAVQGVLDDRYYADALAWMQARVEDARFFVFSDEPAWVEANMAWPEGTTIVQTPADAPAWMDLHLMRQCRHHIIANSSFSWWGAWLGEKPDSLTVAPAVWSRDPARQPAHTVPERWVRL